jgi:hypothetical protein
VLFVGIVAPATAIAFVTSLTLTAVAAAAVVDADMIPDGQYVETVLVARSGVDFSKLKPNDSVRIALVKGVVPVFEPVQ